MSPKKKTSKKLAPCGLCSDCDRVKFEDWKKRAEELAGLEKNFPESLRDADASPRTVLLAEIQINLAKRYPWGIAEVLTSVLMALQSRGEGRADEAAITDLEQLAEDERQMWLINTAAVRRDQNCEFRVAERAAAAPTETTKKKGKRTTT